MHVSRKEVFHMKISHLNEKRRDEWNSFVEKEPYFSLMQSWEWGEFKEKLGWKVVRVVIENERGILAGAQLFIKQIPSKLTSIVYIPRGPIGHWLDERIKVIFLTELHRIAKTYRASFLKIEPALKDDPMIVNELKKAGFHSSSCCNQPRATIIINIDKDPDAILSAMRKKTRQYIRKAMRNEIEIRVGEPNDLPSLYKIMKHTGYREGFIPRSRVYYNEEWQTMFKNHRGILLLAYHRDQLLAIRTVCYFGKHAAEFHAGSIERFNNQYPNYLLVWEAIQWAKAHGCETYDMWGIPDKVGQIVSAGQEPPTSYPTDGLWGVYRFKSGFSKDIVPYVGAYDYIYNSLPYYLFTKLTSTTNALDRVASWLDQVRGV